MHDKATLSRIVCCLLWVTYNFLSASADELEDFRRKNAEALNAFRESNKKEMEDFRLQCNRELVEFMKRPWPEFQRKPPIPVPAPPEPIVLIIPDDEPEPEPNPNPIELIITDIIPSPDPTPRPTPVSPIEQQPEPIKISPVSVTFYGTPVNIRGAQMPSLKVAKVDGNNVAKAYSALTEASMNNLLYDCLEERKRLRLCDWAYLQLLECVSSFYFEKGTNEQKLLHGYMLSQCGYDIRYCSDKTQLHLVYMATGPVYDRSYINIDGKKYTFLTHSESKTYGICNFKFPGEKPISFDITEMPRFAYREGTRRDIRCHSYPEIQVSVTPNQNLIDFYNAYPQAAVNEIPGSRYTVYANIPASNEFKTQLYPKLKPFLQGKSQKDAANILIKLAESFDYKFDSEMWGVAERPLFPDETWNYFYSDCEDHAIHFSRLVRDLLGLDVVMVYYPTHMASAVAFTDGSVTGDYVVYRGKRFTICDPTIFYAQVGVTMDGMNNAQAKLLDLRK